MTFTCLFDCINLCSLEQDNVIDMDQVVCEKSDGLVGEAIPRGNPEGQAMMFKSRFHSSYILLADM